MPKCSRCGNDFDLTYARRSMSRNFYAGVYNDYYPDGDVCEECALEEISADYNAGAELKELMGPSWDDDWD